MFTGIIESTGEIASIKKDRTNLQFGIRASFTPELKEGQSIAHNGVCLTVEQIGPEKNTYYVTAVKETLQKSNLGKQKKGSLLNLERCLRAGDRLDGHFVQGHVDGTAVVTSIKKEKGSWLFEFSIQHSSFRADQLVISKGSISINGVSLTVVSPKVLKHGADVVFSVAIIPHTFTHTNFSSMKKGDTVNIEFDILGKHIQKIISGR